MARVLRFWQRPGGGGREGGREGGKEGREEGRAGRKEGAAMLYSKTSTQLRAGSNVSIDTPSIHT
eukprot:6756266-Lingulodinium_polyedra.AAC.1